MNQRNQPWKSTLGGLGVILGSLLVTMPAIAQADSNLRVAEEVPSLQVPSIIIPPPANPSVPPPQEAERRLPTLPAATPQPPPDVDVVLSFPSSGVNPLPPASNVTLPPLPPAPPPTPTATRTPPPLAPVPARPLFPSPQVPASSNITLPPLPPAPSPTPTATRIPPAIVVPSPGQPVISPPPVPTASERTPQPVVSVPPRPLFPPPPVRASSERTAPLFPSEAPQALGNTQIMSAPPPELLQAPSAKVQVLNGVVKVNLVNQTNAVIIYEVLGDTSRRTLQGRSSVTLQTLQTPVNITFERVDGGLIRLTPQAASEAGSLGVTLTETTSLDLDQRALTVQGSGEVFLN